MDFISKEKFLEEHNKLSPPHLKATLALLERFKEEKKLLLKDDKWSLHKQRIPFISWLSALPKEEKAKEKENKGYADYPGTHKEI
jgi:hypothetical protein